jgi:ribosomal protein S18 acetylase RimI-like enzyme
MPTNPPGTWLVAYDSLAAEQQGRLLELEVEPWQREACGTIEGALYMLEDRPAAAQTAWVLLAQGVPAAFLMLMRAPLTPPWTGPTEALMHSFQVDRRFQRQGLGTACLQALPGVARASWPDITALVLSVDPTNTAAINLYRAQGWVDAGNAYRARVGYERKYVWSLR